MDSRPRACGQSRFSKQRAECLVGWTCEGGPLPPSSPGGPGGAPSLSLSVKSLLGMLKPVAPALLQGEPEFGWGPGFPIVAFRCLSLTAYIIFSSLRIINSLRSVDTLPGSRPALSLPLTRVSHSLFLGEPFARWLPQRITCVCLLTRRLAPFTESEDMPLHRCQFLIHGGDAGAHHSSPGSPGTSFVLINVFVCHQ